MTEAVLVRRIAAVLRARGAVVYRTHGSVFGQAGVGDLIVGWDSRYYELEVKLPGRPLSAIQAHRQAEVRRTGCIAMVVHSVEEAQGWITP